MINEDNTPVPPLSIPATVIPVSTASPALPPATTTVLPMEDTRRIEQKARQKVTSTLRETHPPSPFHSPPLSTHEWKLDGNKMEIGWKYNGSM